VPIHYIAGDILTNEHRTQAFAVACNCEGVMNLHSTVPFREKFPSLYQEFQEACAMEPPALDVGDIFTYEGRDQYTIFNLAIYRNRYLVMAGHRTIEEVFRKLRALLEERQIASIAMPPIGGGTGFIEWARARRSLERTFRDWEGDIYVYMKHATREDQKHWDDADDIDEDKPVYIPRGWKPQMQIYRPTPEGYADEDNRSRGGRRGGRRNRRDRDDNRRGERSGGRRNSRRNNRRDDRKKSGNNSYNRPKDEATKETATAKATLPTAQQPSTDNNNQSGQGERKRRNNNKRRSNNKRRGSNRPPRSKPRRRTNNRKNEGNNAPSGESKPSE